MKFTILTLFLLGLTWFKHANAQSPGDPNEAAHQRIAAKVERIKAGVRKLAESGRDPSAILTTMQQKVGPLLAAGKVLEAEPELDLVLGQLIPDDETKPTPLSAPAPGTPKAAASPSTSGGETQYLTFQVQTGLYGYASQFHPQAGRHSLTKEQMEEFVHSVVKAIGMTGDARHKLAFAIGPLSFDVPDEETRQFIRDAFAVARENDAAVALHIDDSMGWGERKDLLSNSDNFETADWKQIPNTGRRMDWGLQPMKFAPQMCFNAPAIIAAVKDRGALIGTEVKKEMDVLKAAGKEHLFAGLIAGWETRIGRDFETDRPLGYRALSHRGFSESNPPKDADHERVLVVKEFIELWAHALNAPGVPREKIYCHIAFTAQGLDHKEKTSTVSTFALPEVAFGSGYRPGFSTYPSALAFKEIWGHVAAHGSPAWISAEGTNVAPGSGMSSGITMETYLGRMFNHGAVMVNIFAWGIGGEAMRNHFFRRAAEDPEPLAAYGKFLRGEKLDESGPSGFSVEVLEAKMRRIQSELPAWMQKTGKQAEAMALMQKVQSLLKEKKWQEVDKAADEVLALMKGESPAGAKVEPPSTQGGDSKPPQTPPSDDLKKRLTEKVERVKAGARQWAESGRNPSVIARAMEERFKPLMEAGKAAEAEAELDRVLNLLTQDASPAPDNSKEERKAAAPEAAAALEQVATGFRLAEGPVWDGENLCFSDVFPSKIHKLGSDGKVSTIRSDSRKGAGLAFDSKRRLLICEVDGFRVTRIEKDGTEKTLAESYEGKKLNGPNDLVVDARDGIYFTDPLFLNKDKREQDKEAVYYISPAGKVLRVADDLEKPNGIALAVDGKTLFVADTAKSKLRAYPVKEDGTLGEGRDFGTVPGPDGVRVDVDGKVYAAGKTGIAVWDATGKPFGTLKTPTPPNSLTFGDADRRTMFITTNPSVFKIRLDQALKLLTTDGPSAVQAPAPAPAATTEAVHQRIAAKVERIEAGVHKLAESGLDPSPILKTMREKVGPLLDAGKIIEAEPELDRVLEQLKEQAK